VELHVSEGNVKIGNVVSVSLPPVLSCVPGIPCRKKCYALRAWRLYPNTRKAWKENLEIAQQDLAYFERELIANLQKRRSKRYFRWHVSGDIPFPSYVSMMIRVALALPDWHFVCMTKRYSWVEKRNFPSNLTMICSAWGSNCPKNDLPVAQVEFKTGPRKEGIYCPGTCTSCKLCWELERGQTIVFKEH